MKACVLVTLCSLLLTTAQARLGETLSQLKEHLGAPAAQPNKTVTVWTFESRGGQLSYAATFDAKGHSISETLRPVQMADFSSETAQSFITMQLAPYRQSPSLRTVPPGEKYTFGGKTMVCSEVQVVMIDEANGLLIVWTRRGFPSVAALRPEAMQ
jgi:hypothetical protein